MSKNFVEIIPGTYSLEDGATNESKAVYGTKKSDVNITQMSQPFANAPIEIPSMQDTVNILVDQNVKKDNENARLNNENKELAKQNKALDERLKKMGRDCQIVEYEGILCLRWNLYETPVYLANRIINAAVTVQLDTKERMGIFYLLMSEESSRGQILIKEKDLYTERLVILMKNYLDSPLNVEVYVKKIN